MQIARYLSLATAGEQELAKAFLYLAARHANLPDVRALAGVLAQWSQEHIAALAPFVQRYGTERVSDPQRLHKALFQGRRPGSLGLLRDLHDVALLANQVELTYRTLVKGAKAAEDRELETVCTALHEQTKRQLAWLHTHIELSAPQILLMTPG